MKYKNLRYASKIGKPLRANVQKIIEIIETNLLLKKNYLLINATSYKYMYHFYSFLRDSATRR